MDEQLIGVEVQLEDQNNGSIYEKLKQNANKLLNIVENNKLDKIQYMIDSSKMDLINYKYSEYGNKNILTIACINKDISKETLQSLYCAIKSHFSYVDCIDENWYKWEPLHYIARIADPEKLQVLVNHMDNVNSLTTFSENALHVLLEYEESMKPFDTFLYNGSKSRECTVINTEKQNMVQCAEILIDQGIDVNHSNFWNETPICLAIRYRYIKIIKLLLKTVYIDLDNYKEGGKTIREYLKQNYICQDVLPQSNFLDEDPVKLLFNFLKSGDEDRFLYFKNENIKDYVNCIDGDSEHNSSGNMLQFCLKKGFLEYLQHDIYNEDIAECDIMNSPMITVFCAKGLGRCIEHLLNNGADPKLRNRKFPETLLEAAALRGYYPLVAILLKHKVSKITPEDIYEVLPKLFKDKYNLNNHAYYRKHVLCLLLNKLLDFRDNELLSNKKRNILNGVLYNLNLEFDDDKQDDSVNICLILRLGASLTNKAYDKIMVIERLHSDILSMHLDDCIDNNIYCYNSTIEDNKKKYSEIKALSFLANDAKKNKLLRHPLLVHFIHNKWLRIFYFFYFDLFLYASFLLSIYVYMISLQTKSNIGILDGLFYTFLILHTIKECTQLVFLYHWKYFLDTSNYLELTAILCSLITIFNPNEYTMVIAILFSTVVFFILLGQLPACAKYTVIFGSAKYFMQYAGFYFIQFVSFALVFYIIFPFENKPMDGSMSNSTNVEKVEDIMGGFFKSLFYTLIIFTGEFSDRVLEPDSFPVFGRIIMTVFIFCMTIILNNLLVGLIVADMDDMQREGKLYKQIKTANFIVRMNYIIKRLHEFRSFNFIKNIINFLHVFAKGKNKILDINDCTHTGVFDEVNRNYVKELKNKKAAAFDKDILKKLYGHIQIQTSNNLNIIK